MIINQFFNGENQCLLFWNQNVAYITFAHIFKFKGDFKTTNSKYWSLNIATFVERCAISFPRNQTYIKTTPPPPPLGVLEWHTSPLRIKP